MNETETKHEQENRMEWNWMRNEKENIILRAKDEERVKIEGKHSKLDR